MIKKILSVLLITLGVFLLSLPFINNVVIENVSDTTYLKNISAEQLEKNNKKKAVFNYDAVTHIDVVTSLTNIVNIDKEKVIAQIISPSINMNIALFKGLDNSNLFAGAGTMKENQTLGKGNYSVAAHYSKKKNVLFNRILNVKEGTKVYVTDKKNIYEYVVKERKIVPEDAMYMISDDRVETFGKPLLSLMTCPISSKERTRIFATCTLEKVYPYTENNIKKIK